MNLRNASPPAAGGVFSSAIEGGRAGCTITVGHDALTAVSGTGARFELPFAGMLVEMAGASGKMLFCRPPDRSFTLFSEDQHLLELLLGATRGQLQASLRDLHDRSRRRAVALPFTIVVVLALVVALVVIVGPPLWARGVAAALSNVPYEVDQKIGDFAIRTMDLGGPTVSDPRLDQLTQALLLRLTPAVKALGTTLPVHFDIRVVDSDQLNAFALPGGHVVVYTRLIMAAESPEQLAGVIAHEMSHVVRRHGLTGMAQSLGVIGVLQLTVGDWGGLLGLGRELAGVAAVNRYSQGHESQADDDAVTLLLAAEIDPQALDAMLGTMAASAESESEALSWLGTHPQTASRRAAIMQRRGSRNPTTKPLSVDWNLARVALQEKAPTAKDETP